MRSRPVRARRALALTATTVVTALVLAACGSNEEPPEASPEPQETVEGSTLTAQSPLTGEPVEGAAPKHPVMVVKIDNSAASSPQVGLGDADLVAEELVEGGSTRLAAFFYSSLPAEVGPVRSSRATDIGIVEPLGGVLIASGGAPVTLGRLQAEGIRTVTEGGPGFFRSSQRRSPYNLMMNLRDLAKTLKPNAPDPYFTWGTAEDFPGGRPATRIEATYSGGRTSVWTHGRRGYTAENGYAAQGDGFTAQTLVILRVQVGDAGYRDPAGNPVPESRFEGRGQAFVFHGGEVVRGTWTKRGFDGAVTLQTQAGELTLPPGKVYLGLVPANGGDVQFN